MIDIQNDPAKVVTAAIEPVSVAIIGGTVPAGSPLTTGTTATTPDHQPNLVVTVITPIMALLIRALNVYVTAVVGLLAAAMTSNAITAPDFAHLLLKCAGLAIGGTVVMLLKDIVTVTSGLERKFPLATGSV